MKIVLCVLLLCTVACVRVNLGSGASPPTVYLLQPSPAVRMAAPTAIVVMISDFEASPPYDTHDMVLVGARGSMVRAGRHRWGCRPAEACADILWRDLVSSQAVRAAYRRGRIGRDVVVEGHVAECGAREVDGEWYAVLDVTLSALRPGDQREGMQSHLRLERPLETEGFAPLAASMSILLREWSDSAMAFVLGSVSLTPSSPAAPR